MIPRILFALTGAELLRRWTVLNASNKLIAQDNTGELHLSRILILHRHGARSPLVWPSELSGKLKRTQWNMCESKEMDNIINLKADFRGAGATLADIALHSSEGADKCHPGQLTVVGAKQMFDLGIKMRRRYVTNGTLRHKLSVETLLVRSTPYERTVRSALALISGMYPDETRDGNEKIPIHVNDEQHENLTPNLAFRPILLHRIRQRAKQRAKNPECLKAKRDVENLLSMTPNTKQNICKLRDVIECLDAHGDDLPFDVIDAWKKSIDRCCVTRFCENFRNEEGNALDRELLQLLVGTLLHEMLQHITSERRHQILVFSAHDDTLLSVLMALDSSRAWAWPTFASCIVFEVYMSSDGHTYIRVVLNDDILAIKGCSQKNGLCSLALFEAALAPYAIESRQEQ
eukprot:Plantae.Rhodophyta-Hildenbrandia_rubra.ctg32671.p1 GENE.Plantae.Rhodophyta-Hildenbrandia_rubra.ctg32671~~Plantae.Rhodophyta-Hildenbrandia_rubra.ctg32671.p1  ORF type:complete len:404 (-),score=39.99 Plantae.Rhodophyta-Hildenbrandia_rubra.ctg32671:303-1514(-)